MSKLTISNHPLIQHKLSILRSVDTNPTIFRQVVNELGMLLCYESTFDLPIRPIDVETPLMKTSGQVMREHIALIPILRAGLGMVEGIWTLIPNTHVFHIGFYRNEDGSLLISLRCQTRSRCPASCLFLPTPPRRGSRPTLPFSVLIFMVASSCVTFLRRSH